MHDSPTRDGAVGDEFRTQNTHVVPTGRLELPRLSPPPPQDGVSTNSTTSAGLARSSFPPVRDCGHACYFGTSPAFEPPGAGAAGLGVGTEVGGMLSGADFFSDFFSSTALLRSITPWVSARLLPM